MTVCIAAKAKGGKSLILAADQMATMPHILREAESAHKIVPLTEKIYLMLAGNEAPAKQIYKEALAKKDGITTVEEALQLVTQAFTTVRLQTVQTLFLLPRGLTMTDFLNSQRTLDQNIVSLIDQQISQYQFGVHLLVAGINPDGNAHIYEVAPIGLTGEHDHFAAIGSGQGHAANSLLARGYIDRLTETEATYLVFEAKKRSEVAPGVGVNTDMTVLSVDDDSKVTAKAYTDDELSALNDTYKDMVDEEQKLLKTKLDGEKKGGGKPS